MKARLLSSFLALALVVILLGGSTASACGPFELEALFTFTAHPDFPLERFANGSIGVVQPSYARSYLFVAYRQLSGIGFTEQEQKSLTQLWKDRMNFNWELGDQEWIKEWLAARKKVSGLPEEPHIEVYRNREKPNEYETYLNCQKDAFQTASTTLAVMIKKYGDGSSPVLDWVKAQDQVFANCSKGQEIPAALPDSADPLLRSDRNYQIAAASFYAGNFDEAKKVFEAISTDNNSPWQGVAPYLVARTLVRKASLGPAETKADSLSEAERDLRQILTNPKISDSHPGATRLLNVVRNRLHPVDRLHELAQALLVKNQGEAIKQELWDYTVLLDDFLGTDDSENKPKPNDEIRIDDLTDWIVTFESPAVEALDHSLAKWQSTPDMPWLIASLSKIDGKHPKSSDLIAAAMKIKPDSPAFPSTRFHVVRLLAESGKADEARTLLDELLKNYRSRFDESSLNLLTSQRMSLARSLAEFLTFAPRVPAGFSWNDDGREIPADASELSEESRGLQGKVLFDVDAANVLNQRLPLSLLKEAARSNALPEHLRRDLAQAAWLRAVLLGDNKTAEELVPTLKTLVPEFSSFLDDFAVTTQPDAKKFSAIYAWLRFPGLEPVIDVGIGRRIPLGQQDTYRDNWWCGSAFPTAPVGPSDEEKNLPQAFTAPQQEQAPAFLTDAQRTAAAREHSALIALGAAPNYLCQQVVQWVTKNPNDPRAAEALHLAVNTTRHGCTDKATGRWSKAAFDLLHRKYPNSIWARKTPYWFKD